LHLIGQLLIKISDARNHKHKKIYIYVIFTDISSLDCRVPNGKMTY